MFGGVTAADGAWAAEWDTMNTEWFFAQCQAQEKPNFAPYVEGLANYYMIPSMRVPRLFVDPYVYIHGTPEQSVWTPNGDTTDVLIQMPRTRPAGSITTDTAFVKHSTH